MKKISFLLPFLFGIIFLTSCEKEQMGSITVTFEDSGAPITYEEVVIDVRRVEVIFANANSNNDFGKYFLDAHAGEFDFAALSTSENNEIANKQRMPVGNLTELRIVVGSNNFIRVNGVKHNLFISNSPDSGLTIPLDNKGIYAGQKAEIVLKINVAGSVQQSGGSYTLNPIIVVGS